MNSKRAVEVEFQNDVVNEQNILVAACVSDEIRKSLVSRLQPDTFISPEHQQIWQALQEMERKKLRFDPVTIFKLTDGNIKLDYIVQLLEYREETPPNLDFHIEHLLWDKAKHNAITGPISSLLEALQNPKETPERVRSLSRQISETFDGYQDRKFLHEPTQLIHSQLKEIRARISGHAIYPYGIEGLDKFLDGPAQGERRIIPGAAPGQITVITGTPGTGKSTTTAQIILGLARQRRKVLVGAWEMKGGTTLELLAIISLKWSRSMVMNGKLTEEQVATLEKRMLDISKYVRFMDIPFGRSRGERGSNDANLDLVHGYIADSGCEVFVADLWKRALRRTDPEEEELALIRQQAMAEELKVHCILVQQQRAKDIEARRDKKPTREGIKGSGAWTEVADTILGVHRPALWKAIEDNVLEIDVLKQRYGKWPLAVEFNWNSETGQIDGGTSIQYDQPMSERDDNHNSIDVAAFGRGNKSRR